MRTNLTRSSLAFVACLFLSVAQRSVAAPNDPVALAAKADIDAGRMLREKGDLKGARARFRAAFKAQASAVAGYELGLTLRALGDLNGAYDILMQVGELKVDGVEEIGAQRSAATLLAEIDPLIPMAIFDLGALAPEVTKVEVDGALLPREEWTEAQPFNPGKHVVIVYLRDGSALKKSFTINERARARLTFAPPGALPKASPDESPDADEEPAPRLRCPEGSVLRANQCWMQGRDYTVQLAIVDGLSTAALAGGVATQVVPLMITGAVAFPLASPIVHWSHGRVGRGFGSFGLHAGALLGTIVTWAALARENDHLPEGPAALATLLWGGAAFGLDHLIIPHGDETKVAPTRTGLSLQLVMVAPIRGGAAASLTFSF